MSAPSDDRIDTAAVCYRHKNRPTNVRCQNCGKPICGDCMHDSPVGYRCPDCAGSSRQIFRDDLIVTKTLLGACLAVYLLQVVLGIVNGLGVDAVMNNNGSGDYLSPIYIDGALWADVMAASGDWWRPFTSGFLHAGLLHIALNSYFIWSFGQLLEPALGRARFALVYFVGMLGGAVGALLLSNPAIPTVGASGAGFGLLGAALVMARIRRNEDLAQQLMVLAAINFAFTFLVSGISVGGHVGGFLAGALCGYLAYGPLMRKQKVLLGVLAGLAVVLFVASIVVAGMVSDF